eukprot:scaffold2290_cov170-Amphora_coffeaeformis.AAC.9
MSRDKFSKLNTFRQRHLPPRVFLQQASALFVYGSMPDTRRVQLLSRLGHTGVNEGSSDSDPTRGFALGGAMSQSRLALSKIKIRDTAISFGGLDKSTTILFGGRHYRRVASLSDALANMQDRLVVLAFMKASSMQVLYTRSFEKFCGHIFLNHFTPCGSPWLQQDPIPPCRKLPARRIGFAASRHGVHAKASFSIPAGSAFGWHSSSLFSSWTANKERGVSPRAAWLAFVSAVVQTSLSRFVGNEIVASRLRAKMFWATRPRVLLPRPLPPKHRVRSM